VVHHLKQVEMSHIFFHIYFKHDLEHVNPSASYNPFDENTQVKYAMTQHLMQVNEACHARGAKLTT